MTPITLSRQRHSLLVEGLADRAQPFASSRHFTVYGIDADDPAACDPFDIVLVHDFAPAEIDNNIAAHVADELLPLLTAAPRPAANGAATEQELFERFVGEIVRSVDGDEHRAWHLFYNNTLAAFRGTGRRGGSTRSDFIADFTVIYRKVACLTAEVAPASFLDVGTCFGFLPLLLATSGSGGRQPRRIVACDLNAALVSLAAGYAEEQRLDNVHFLQADLLAAGIASQLAPATPPFDVVTAIHLLEHLTPEETGPAMDALWSLTRRRLIVAVPVENVADARFGHLQVFARDSLAALGQGIGGRCRSFEDHGAWLVIDREGHA